MDGFVKIKEKWYRIIKTDSLGCKKCHIENCSSSLNSICEDNNCIFAEIKDKSTINTLRDLNAPRVKTYPEIVKSLEEDGYTVEVDRFFHSVYEDFYFSMFGCCGKIADRGYNWRDKWLEI